MPMPKKVFSITPALIWFKFPPCSGLINMLLSGLLLSGLLLSGCTHIAGPAPTLTTRMADAHAYDLQQAGLAVKQNLDKNQPVVALVLGSGGARGYAHIGVIRVLETYGIKPQLIVGSSAGSIVGALYASGKNAAQMDKIASSLKSSDVRDITLSRQGFFNSEKVADFVNKQVNNRPLQQLDIPFFVVATELQSGTRTVFSYGNTGQAVSASISIPSMFVPTSIGKKQYVDGGLVSPVPVEVAKSLGADVIIAVNILAQPQNTPTTNIWGLFNQNINVMQNRLASYELKNADIVIQPNIKEKQHIFSLDARMQNIAAGEHATQLQIDKIKYVIDTAQQKLALDHSLNVQAQP